MSLILTPEQRRLVEQAGNRPVLIEDEMHQEYVLIRADVYERVRDAIDASVCEAISIPEGIRKSQQAFFRDLPGLLGDRRLLGRYVAYHGDEQVKLGRSETEVVRECLRHGLSDDEYDVFIIEPQSPEPEEIDYPSAWCEA